MKNALMPIYWQKIPFDDQNNRIFYKIRPVIVLGWVSRNKVAVLKMTTQYKYKPADIRAAYYRVTNMYQAGLSTKDPLGRWHHSYVDTHCICEIRCNTLMEYIGALSLEDIQGLLNKIKMLISLNVHNYSKHEIRKQVGQCQSIIAPLPPASAWRLAEFKQHLSGLGKHIQKPKIRFNVRNKKSGSYNYQKSWIHRKARK